MNNNNYTEVFKIKPISIEKNSEHYNLYIEWEQKKQDVYKCLTTEQLITFSEFAVLCEKLNFFDSQVHYINGIKEASRLMGKIADDKQSPLHSLLKTIIK